MSEYSERVAKDLDAYSRPFAEQASLAFNRVRNSQLKAVSQERRTMREAIDTMRRALDKLRAAYLRTTGTTYQAWLDHGPHAEWEEVVAAAKDDAVWDRLVERCVERTQRGADR